LEVLERIDAIVPDRERRKKQEINVPISFEVVSLLYRPKTGKEEGVDVRVELFDPQDELINKIDLRVNFQPEHLRMRSRLGIKGLKLTVSGHYFFRISIKSPGKKKYRQVAEVPLEVKILSKPSKEKEQTVN
jgi:hypothetical protein